MSCRYNYVVADGVRLAELQLAFVAYEGQSEMRNGRAVPGVAVGQAAAR